MDETSLIFRPTSGRWLAGVVAVLAAYGLVSLVASGDVTDVVRYGPGVALVGALVWAAYWRPSVEVSDAGVTLHNVLRSIELPWPSIQRIDTRYALTLVTAYGTYAAWAAPAPGRRRTKDVVEPELRGLPESTYGPAGSVRPGDLPGTPSGDAAAIVRLRWEALRDAGHLDQPRLERSRPVTRWDRVTVTVLAVLAAATVVGLVATHQP